MSDIEPFKLLIFGVIPSVLAACYFIVLHYKGNVKLQEKRVQLEEVQASLEDVRTQLEHKGERERELIGKVHSLRSDVERLSPYRKIVDAEAEVKRLRQRAEEVTNAAEMRAQDLISEAKKDAAEKQSKAKETVDIALLRADQIVAEARERGEAIAGSALAAKENSELYEKAVRAMKNVIKGYGDEYIIPTRSLLDELAEEFEHKDGGAKLKEARAYTKQLVKKGIAAECDYVQDERKNTAIRFVLDAFNGKVDTVLSKVKHNNYGKLKQEIEDAFNLVNSNGRAFKDARIRPSYLTARLDELRWAVTTHELKLEEREEQRQIKEAIREEEKARREYEKAIKAAEKEEKLLQDAMAKARKELGEASVEQRDKLEMQLQELQAKLEEAEAKNERAISMAQQTRRGHVYVISNVGSFGEDVFKIGLTRRLEPLDRVKELGDASVPFPFDVHAMIYSEDAPSLETELHRTFEQNQINKVNSRKEFFQVGIKAIREIVDARGLETHWTMKAEAAEYRESLALAKVAMQEAS